jgi:hypothetical protein
MALLIRKLTTVTEEIYTDGARELARPLRLAAAIAVIANPYAGRYEEDLYELSESYSKELGTLLTDRAAAALGVLPTVFGKASYVGEAGEVQHGSAIIHSRGFGDPMRKVTNGIAPVPSVEKRGGVGGTVDVPIRSAADRGDLTGTSVTDLNSWEIRLADAPHADELLIAVVLGDGGRPNSRIR